MDVKTALAERKSTRAFLDKEVPIDVINTIIEQSKTAPSGANTQPWQVAVVTGKSKTNLCNKLEETFRAGNKGAMDYHYYPTEWAGEYKERRRDCGLLLYSTLEITREDKQRQLDQWALNYQAFNAPVILLFLWIIFYKKALIWIAVCLYNRLCCLLLNMVWQPVHKQPLGSTQILSEKSFLTLKTSYCFVEWRLAMKISLK